MINKKSLGNYGEDLACEFLIKKGYTILERNFNCRLGELDIICMYRGILVFIEVKCRYSLNYGVGIESINSTKVKRIISSSKLYIHLKNLYNLNVRYDIMNIDLNLEENKKNIQHYEDAFRL
ncbi:YraN family protein [Clostridium intestinale]|uniref:UPF0102 protein HZF06_10590 n=1 Tax=Clostridium intestinale TaxID=36845 RepID=A0A7D6VU87_9CLOT|nr:YraN family protein [Clostridium intestinale]QLY82008.1 YraN family protein [Clostridium intestinale]